MPLVSTKVDLCKGHDACPPRPMASFSPNVFAETFEVARQEDDLQSHGCPQHVPHGASITAGYPTVFANGKPIGYIGASVSCPSGQIATGRPTVKIGEGASTGAPPRRASSGEVLIAATLPEPGVVSDSGGTLLAFDHGEREGLFRNDSDVTVLVTGDSGSSSYIRGTVVPPGGSARGDAVMFPDATGAFGPNSRLYKVPNRSTWNVTGSNGSYDVSGAGLSDGALMFAAQQRNGSDHYQWMSLDHYFQIMGKDEIHVDMNGTTAILGR